MEPDTEAVRTGAFPPRNISLSSSLLQEEIKVMAEMAMSNV
jgi:hypothetical protein